ncbi:hypothetical protein [Gloeobacter violaceus]|uniref:Glr0836 protein n=1 Tax=Gloeobacter violaceus (strain ATCC 29082 / PCC 7421) TaxID=251221 RepID=Q7NMD0_GLOVI|nr:hypothetical protein [Gloeobacter violaceus]BAC88777.1 glr0836 [Gloeobacter violaceus PCC 7421]
MDWLQVPPLLEKDPESPAANGWGTVLANDLDSLLFGSQRGIYRGRDPLKKRYGCDGGQLIAEASFCLRLGGCLLKGSPEIRFCSNPLLEVLLREALEALPSYPIWLADRCVEARYRIGIDAGRNQVQIKWLPAPLR